MDQHGDEPAADEVTIEWGSECGSRTSLQPAQPHCMVCVHGQEQQLNDAACALTPTAQ